MYEDGLHFRSRELQRLDPATCVADPANPNACAFSVTGIQNNYLDFNGGQLYWRFCADYDEPFVGLANTPHDDDDPDDQLNFDPYGFCPKWDELSSSQQTRRVASGDLGGDRIFATSSLPPGGSFSLWPWSLRK